MNDSWDDDSLCTQASWGVPGMGDHYHAQLLPHFTCVQWRDDTLNLTSKTKLNYYLPQERCIDPKIAFTDIINIALL